MNPSQNPSELPVDSLLEQSSTSDDEIEKKVAQLLRQDLFREKTKQIIVEHTDTVAFMKKVQVYADEQIDRRLFKNTKVIIGVILGWIATAVITFAVTKLTK
jgi:hypothetical protein